MPELLGGVSGTDFLVIARRLDQTRVGRGVTKAGVVKRFGEDPSIKTIRYKTLDLTDRQCSLGYLRVDRMGRTET